MYQSWKSSSSGSCNFGTMFYSYYYYYDDNNNKYVGLVNICAF